MGRNSSKFVPQGGKASRSHLYMDAQRISATLPPVTLETLDAINPKNRSEAIRQAVAVYALLFETRSKSEMEKLVTEASDRSVEGF